MLATIQSISFPVATSENPLKCLSRGSIAGNTRLLNEFRLATRVTVKASTHYVAGYFIGVIAPLTPCEHQSNGNMGKLGERSRPHLGPDDANFTIVTDLAVAPA